MCKLRRKCRARVATTALALMIAGIIPGISTDYSFAGNYAVPPTVVEKDIDYTGRIAIDGPAVAVSLPTPNKNGILTFEGTAGQRITIGFSGITMTQMRASVYSPDGAIMTVPPTYVTHYYAATYQPEGGGKPSTVASFTTNGGSIDLPALPASGTYTILLDPVGIYTGNLTVTVSTEVAGEIAPQGSPVPIAISRIGQNARYTFAGTLGQSVSLQLSGVTIPSGYVAIVKPDGSVLGSAMSFGGSGAVIDTQVLPATGTYSVLIDPALVYTGYATLAVYNIPDIAGTMMIDSAPTVSMLTVPGQRARYTFSGTAGQWINLGCSSVRIANSTVSIVAPDGTTFASATIGPSGGSIDPTTVLPATGPYTVVIDPAENHTGTMSLALTTPVSATIALDGAPTSVSLPKEGRTARYTFTGAAGQWVSMGFTSVTITSSTITLLNPDGTTAASTTVGRNGGSLAVPGPLATAGTYTIIVDPASTYTGDLTMTLSTDLTGTVANNSAGTTIKINRPGQNARYTFTGNANQKATVKVSGNNIGNVNVDLYTKSGILQTGATNSSSSFNLPQVPLIATDIYTVTINPMTTATGTLHLQVVTQ
jgi:hypothetical protein